MDTIVIIALVLLGWILGSAALLFLVGALHEGGHALAALLLQPGPVTVHLGTYGRPTSNWQLQLGRLRVHLAYTSIWWRGGYCQAPAMAQAGRWGEALFILAGPLLPLLVTGLAAWLASTQKPSFDSPAYVPWLVSRTVALAALAVAVISALFNLLPRRKPLALVDGRLLLNDGQQLLNTWRRPQLTAALTAQAQQAEAHRLAGEYAESAALYAAIIPRARPTRALLGQAIHVFFQVGRYAEALALSTQQHRDFAAEITADDRFGHALLLSRTDQHVSALEAYSALIDQPQPYPMAYNNRGYTHNLLGNYELALADFDQAISLGIEPAHAHSNRGLALTKLGQTEAGLAAINYGLVLDSTNAYGYRNLGIHHLDRGEYTVALRYFEQAQQLDPTTHELGTYLQKAHQHLARSTGTGGTIQQ